MPGVARIDTERLANLRRTLASIVSGTSQAENKLYDISRETAERRALRDILARYGAETGPRDVVQQMLKPSPYPTSPTGELAEGPAPAPAPESVTTQEYPGADERRTAAERALGEMLQLRTAPSISAAGVFSKLVERPDLSVTPFEAYLKARTPEEKARVVEAWRSTQPPKQPANRIHTGRVKGADNFYYDVYVDPDTQKAEYVKSPLQAPETEEPGAAQEKRTVESYAAQHTKAMSTINGLVKRHGERRLNEILQTVMRMPEYSQLMAQPEKLQEAFLASILDANLRERLRIARDYSSALITTDAMEKNLGRLGKEIDAGTGKLYDAGKGPRKTQPTAAPGGTKGTISLKQLKQQIKDQFKTEPTESDDELRKYYESLGYEVVE
jgi:hypothetical protein